MCGPRGRTVDKCGTPLLGPHEGVYQIPGCPGAGCGRKFRVVRGHAPNFVERVEEIP